MSSTGPASRNCHGPGRRRSPAFRDAPPWSPSPPTKFMRSRN
ncbi:CxxxxCH/CxxCH domain-containing protein [Parvibaculum sp.]|nr:hypothetical protein [Rhodobiaceae bacterium]